MYAGFRKIIGFFTRAFVETVESYDKRAALSIEDLTRERYVDSFGHDV